MDVDLALPHPAAEAEKNCASARIRSKNRHILLWILIEFLDQLARTQLASCRNVRPSPVTLVLVG